MEELLKKTPSSLVSFAPGGKVKGKIVDIGGKNIILDIGAKSEGVVVEGEFAKAADFARSLKVGDFVDAEVLVPETSAGQALLSLAVASETWAWATLTDAYKTDQEVEAIVDGVVRAGLAVIVLGLSGFVPSSQVSAKIARDMQAVVGLSIKTKVIELDRSKNRVVLSERAVSEAEVVAKQEKALSSIKAGEKFKGQVVGLTDFGAFVRIKKDGVSLDGLVHLSQVSWTKIANVKDVLKEGDTVEVIVIGKESPGKLALSIRQAQEDPWKKIAGKYKAEAQVRGLVTKISELGVFVELEPGIQGLLRSGKIPAEFWVKEGETIDCFIEDADEANHKIGLGLVLKSKPVGYK